MSFNDEVDGWVSQLMGCKPLSEAEVKKLCDKASLLILLRGGASNTMKAYAGKMG